MPIQRAVHTARDDVVAAPPAWAAGRVESAGKETIFTLPPRKEQRSKDIRDVRRPRAYRREVVLGGGDVARGDVRQPAVDQERFPCQQSRAKLARSAKVLDGEIRRLAETLAALEPTHGAVGPGADGIA